MRSSLPEPREFKTVTICGSMRFYDRMIKVAERLTASGEVVIMPFVTVAAEDQGDDFKAMLDRMHRQKIDMADRVVVVTDNEGGYIGQSTQAEIRYAESIGKQLDFAMEPPLAPTGPVVLHKPFPDDGVTYCGWATGDQIIDGCGEVWPCSAIRAGGQG